MTGPKSARDGYPAIFFGQAAATKTLVEIAALGSVRIDDLPERQRVTAQNLGFTVRRLTAVGLVRRFHRAEHPKRFDLTFDTRHALAAPVAAVLRSIARANGLTWPPRRLPPEAAAVQETNNVTALEIFGQPRTDIITMFGSRQRTMAVLLVAALPVVDATTIASLVGVARDGDMHKLMDPIEKDGLIVSKMVGSIRLYSLAPGRWVKSLRALAEAIVSGDATMAGRVVVARMLLVSGGFSNRKHLRRRLGLQ